MPPYVWHPLSFRSLLTTLGWRNRRLQLLLLAWVAFTLICIESGRIADRSTWINVPVRFLGSHAFVTIFPPVFLCQFAMFMLGFEWAVIPAFLSMLVVCLDNGMSAGGSTIIALGQPAGLAICALIYRAAPFRVDLKTWPSVASYVGITTAACTAGATVSLVWSAATELNSAQTFAVWEGWVLGAICSVVLMAAVPSCVSRCPVGCRSG